MMMMMIIISSWNGVILHKLIVSKIVKKFPELRT
jgi:hypothetical protein